MRKLFVLLFSAGLLASGCATDNLDGLESLELESALDAKLAKSTVSAQAPEAEPGDPQKGFKQETAQALNP